MDKKVGTLDPNPPKIPIYVRTHARTHARTHTHTHTHTNRGVGARNLNKLVPWPMHPPTQPTQAPLGVCGTITEQWPGPNPFVYINPLTSAPHSALSLMPLPSATILPFSTNSLPEGTLFSRLFSAFRLLLVPTRQETPALLTCQHHSKHKPVLLGKCPRLYPQAYNLLGNPQNTPEKCPASNQINPKTVPADTQQHTKSANCNAQQR